MKAQIFDKRLKQIIEDLKPYNPEKIILYGSFARGDYDSESDIDLLIVKETKKPKHRRLDDVFDLVYKDEYFGTDRFVEGLDPRVYTTEEIKKESSLGNFFIRNILREGKIVYERE